MRWLLMFFAFGLCSAVAARELTIYSEEFGRASYLDGHGKPAGSSVELVQEMQRRVKNGDAIDVVPWSRAYFEALNRPNIALFSMARTPERESLFHWVGPLIKLKFAFYGKAGRHLKISKLDDARRLRSIGVVRSDARTDILKKEGFTNLVESTTDVINVKNLMAGRIDVYTGINPGYGESAQAAGHSASDLEELLVFGEAELYLAFSKETSAAVIAPWRQAMEEMRRDGTFKKIYQKWYPSEKAAW